jgi:hypothetical protein
MEEGGALMDQVRAGCTVGGMENREIRERILPTPFYTSFIGKARMGNLEDQDPAKRAGAWATWSVENLTEIIGVSERSYAAINLEGRFYDPKGNGPRVRPHLEIPERMLSQPCSEFPERLAQMGNGLRFPWWVMSEVTATRRALFNTATGEVSIVFKELNEHADSIRAAVSALNEVAAPGWETVQSLLGSSPDGLSGDATGDFTEEEVASFFPGGRKLHLTVQYDVKLREKNGNWASRRVGVWQVCGVNPNGERFSFGVLTPRLTVNSLFVDSLFEVSREAPAALLVRGLLLKRIIDKHLGGSRVSVAGVRGATTKPSSFLRSVPAKPGAKLPEASLDAAIHFIQTYPDPEAAFDAVEEWARRSGAVVTVLREGFVAAHRRASRFLRRAEEIERDDVDVLLPLAWDDKNRVVRLTFVRGEES